MKKYLKQYVWVWEWFAAAILISFAITAVIKNEFLVYAFGAIFVIFALFRIVPLIQTTDSKLIKWLNFLEMLIDVAAGVCLFAFSEKIKEAQNLFGYIVGGVLYLRGVMHFLATSIKSEPTTLTHFVINIALISVGAVIIARGGFSAKALAWFFFAVIVICVLALIWRGTVDYKNYRGNLVGEAKTKKLKKAKENGAKILLDASSEFTLDWERNIFFTLADGIFINVDDYQHLVDNVDGDPKKMLFNRGCEFICVTDGSNGTVLYTKDEVIKAESCKTDVIDSTGAGDSFAGGFVYGLLQGYPLEKCLRIASVSGSYACTKFGGQGGCCTIEELYEYANKKGYKID